MEPDGGVWETPRDSGEFVWIERVRVRIGPDSAGRYEDATGDTTFGNDPSAGSPTDTLLRLLRPLPRSICASSRPPMAHREAGLRVQSEELINWSDR